MRVETFNSVSTVCQSYARPCVRRMRTGNTMLSALSNSSSGMLVTDGYIICMCSVSRKTFLLLKLRVIIFLNNLVENT